MTREHVVYLLPYLISLGLSLGVTLYTWRHGYVQGATAYGWFAAGHSLWTLGFILETLSPSLEGKIFWDEVEWLAGAAAGLAFPVFAVQFTDTKITHSNRLWGLLAIAPGLFLVTMAVGEPREFIYSHPRLIPGQPFSELTYEYTPAVYAYGVYFYALNFVCMGVLIRAFIYHHRLYRAQIATVIAGFFIPLAGTMLALANVSVTPQRDAAPLTFGIGNLVVAWGFFRYRLFDVGPIARNTVIENLPDIIIVVDVADRVVDINPAGLAAVGVSASQAIGKPAEQVFARWSELIDRFREIHQTTTAISAEIEGAQRVFELSIAPVYNRRRQLLGRVVVARDITSRKALEQTLRLLNSELEQRVLERTQDLVRAYDTTLEGWAKALELRDKETEGHSRRVTEWCLRLARAMGLSESELIDVRRGALLHDIGKMAIPDEILRKSDRLTPEERLIVNQHPVIAHELLAPIPFLHKAVEIPLCHHEKWDGSGYPSGLRGKQIPLSARIFAVVDVWDALCSDRPYNKAWPREQVIQYIRSQMGISFDPNVVRVFLKMIEDSPALLPPTN